MPAATRRPRLPPSVGLVLAGMLAALAYVAATAVSQADDSSLIATIPALPAPAGEAWPVAADASRRLGAERADRAGRDIGEPTADPSASAAVEIFATVEGLELGLPHDDAVLVAFHEASMREALSMTPVGQLEGNENPSKFAGGQDADGHAYRILSSRGRPRAATSAVDVVVQKGATVVAPVSGRVVEARDYALYGATRDWRVVIEPHDRRDLHVVLIHLHQPAVQVGDEVTAGHSPLAVARQLAFSSQVDHVTGDRLPHVHLEVKAAIAPMPVDPNAAAVDPDDTIGAEAQG